MQYSKDVKISPANNLPAGKGMPTHIISISIISMHLYFTGKSALKPKIFIFYDLMLKNGYVFYRAKA